MTDETIVAVYDIPVHAARAAQELEEAGVPECAISIHSGNAVSSTTAIEPKREPGFWSLLFGGEADYGVTAHNRSAADEATIVTVNVSAEDASRTIQILARHAPIGLDAQTSNDGVSDATDVVGDRLHEPCDETTRDGVATNPDADSIRFADAGKWLGGHNGNFFDDVPMPQLVTRREASHAVDRHPGNDELVRGGHVWLY